MDIDKSKPSYKVVLTDGTCLTFEWQCKAVVSDPGRSSDLILFKNEAGTTLGIVPVSQVKYIILCD